MNKINNICKKADRYYILTKLAFIEAPQELVNRLFSWVGGAYIGYIKAIAETYYNLPGNKIICERDQQIKSDWEDLFNTIKSFESKFDIVTWSKYDILYHTKVYGTVMITRDDLSGWRWGHLFNELMDYREDTFNDIKKSIRNKKNKIESEETDPRSDEYAGYSKEQKEIIDEKIIDKKLGFTLSINCSGVKNSGKFYSQDDEMIVNIINIPIISKIIANRNKKKYNFNEISYDDLATCDFLISQVDSNYIEYNLYIHKIMLEHELSHALQYMHKQTISYYDTTRGGQDLFGGTLFEETPILGLGPKLKRNYDYRGAPLKKDLTTRQEHNLRAIEFYPRLLGSVRDFEKKIEDVPIENRKNFIKEFIGMNGITNLTHFNFKDALNSVEKAKKSLEGLSKDEIDKLDPKIINLEERVYQNMVKAFLKEINSLGYSI